MEIRNESDFFNFSPIAVERYCQNNQQHQPYETPLDQLQNISPSYHQSNSQNRIPNLNQGKRKLDANDYSENKRINLSFMQSYAQILLTPPSTPGAHGHTNQGTSLEHLQGTWSLDTCPMTYQNYNMANIQDSENHFQQRNILHTIDNNSPTTQSDSRHQVTPLQYPRKVNLNENLSTNLCPGLNYLYEKSLNSVRRWRENGLTVQLFYCIVCQFPSDDEQRLRQHIDSQHSRSIVDGKYFCEKCQEIFYNEEGFLQHKSLFHKNQTDCNGCGRDFATKSNLKSHEEDCFECKPHRCEYCGKGFVIFARVKNHRLTCEMGPKSPIFTCKVCSKTFTKKENYYNHVPIHAFM